MEEQIAQLLVQNRMLKEKVDAMEKKLESVPTVNMDVEIAPTISTKNLFQRSGTRNTRLKLSFRNG